MGAVEYTNLRLSFKQRGDREYEVTAAIDDGPTTTSTFTIPMSDEALQDAIRNLSETRSALAEPATRKVTPVTGKQVSAQEFGTTLADALITGDVATMFNEARSRGAVRVRLNMTNEPELLRIPWEFLRRNGKDLASQRDSHHRPRAGDRRAGTAPTTWRARSACSASSPTRGAISTSRARSPRVEEAIAKCSDQDRARVARELHLQVAAAKAARTTYHILHFVGHSAFTDEGESILLLSDETGQTKEASADSVAQLIGRSELAAARRPQLVRRSADQARRSLRRHRDDLGATGQERGDRDAVRDHRQRRQGVRRGAVLLASSTAATRSMLPWPKRARR